MPSSAPTLSGLHFALTFGDADGNFSGSGLLTVSGLLADPIPENFSPGGC